MGSRNEITIVKHPLDWSYSRTDAGLMFHFGTCADEETREAPGPDFLSVSDPTTYLLTRANGWSGVIRALFCGMQASQLQSQVKGSGEGIRRKGPVQARTIASGGAVFDLSLRSHFSGKFFGSLSSVIVAAMLYRRKHEIGDEPGRAGGQRRGRHCGGWSLNREIVPCMFLREGAARCRYKCR